MDKISDDVIQVQIDHPAEPKTREEFLEYSCQLTLDPNTAQQYPCLSEENRKVTISSKVQLYPDHSDRFTFFKQVLCREALSGACYWEWSGKWVCIAVSYKIISRKGDGNECLGVVIRLGGLTARPRPQCRNTVLL